MVDLLLAVSVSSAGDGLAHPDQMVNLTYACSLVSPALSGCQCVDWWPARPMKKPNHGSLLVAQFHELLHAVHCLSEWDIQV